MSRRRDAWQPAYLLTYQLSVNAIQELRRDALRDGESNEKSEGEEGGRRRTLTLNVSKMGFFRSLASFSPHLLSTLRLPVCCCRGNLPVSFSLAVIPCRCEGNEAQGEEMEEGREGRKEGKEGSREHH